MPDVLALIHDARHFPARGMMLCTTGMWNDGQTDSPRTERHVAVSVVRAPRRDKTSTLQRVSPLVGGTGERPPDSARVVLLSPSSWRHPSPPGRSEPWRGPMRTQTRRSHVRHPMTTALNIPVNSAPSMEPERVGLWSRLDQAHELVSHDLEGPDGGAQCGKASRVMNQNSIALPLASTRKGPDHTRSHSNDLLEGSNHPRSKSKVSPGGPNHPLAKVKGLSGWSEPPPIKVD